MWFMRAGPLSDDRIIDLLNRHFVPVSVSNDAYTRGEISKEDHELKISIVRESWKDDRIIRTGEDAVYVLTPDGKFYDAIRAPDSIRVAFLRPFLERMVSDLKVKPLDRPIVDPMVQSKRPKTSEGQIVLHNAARYIPKGEGWAKMPAEDWIVLDRGEWSKFLPANDAKIGTRWDVDSEVVRKILVNFYPPTGNTDTKKNKIENMVLTATLVSRENGTARVRLDGALKMKHPWFTTGLGPGAAVQQGEEYFVEIKKIIGFVDCDLEAPAIRSLRVLGDKATYATYNFVVALRLAPLN